MTYASPLCNHFYKFLLAFSIAIAFQLNTPSSAMSFSITGSSQLMGSIVGTNCATDWIQIPCATNTMDVMLQTGTPGMQKFPTLAIFLQVQTAIESTFTRAPFTQHPTPAIKIFGRIIFDIKHLQLNRFASYVMPTKFTL